MPTFTPPVVSEVPPVTPTAQGVQARLYRFYQSRNRGVAVFKMSDGTYQTNRPVTGVSASGSEPYPSTPETASDATAGIGVVNDALAWSWYAGKGTEYPLTAPTVVTVYYGGHTYTISTTEAAALTAAGFGPYIT